MDAIPAGLARYQYFPPDYAAGRIWFEAAVTARSGAFRSYAKPAVTGADGGPLSIDVGWFGSRSAAKVFVSLCGTHGQEYFCGAAGQLQWIDALAKHPLPDDIAVCLVHAVNPYGAAHQTRTNENLVDLNRNFRDHKVPRPPHPLHDAVLGTIAPKAMDDLALYDLAAAFNALAAQHDTGAIMTAIAGGQDAQPAGMAYAGTTPEWETRTLSRIAREWLQHARKVALIDWHTGLRPTGEASVLCDLDDASEAYALACQWWGKPSSADALYEGGVEPDIEGEVRHGLAALCAANGASVVQTVVELGTVDNQAIIPAFAIDRWLRTECPQPNSPDAIRLRTIMMERYCPSVPAWRAAALAAMAALYAATINGLRQWDGGSEEPATSASGAANSN